LKAFPILPICGKFTRALIAHQIFFVYNFRFFLFHYLEIQDARKDSFFSSFWTRFK
jgi:hypothetical protein